jgi:superfamily II DNA or RNA helicase
MASGAEVARALASSCTPPECRVSPPAWLLQGHGRSFRRVLAALERYRGALLAEPVGSGKTYVALAVAQALQGRHPVACLVPAPLAAQWGEIAARLGVAAEVGTHQLASRGRLPNVASGLVIIDESHHFRNPRTRRYAFAAPWLVGRPVLLLSATPVVNRLDDLAHQLLLGVRDDALVAEGVVSLRDSLAHGHGPAALGRLVIEDTAAAGPRPGRHVTRSLATAAERRLAERSIANLARLRLSRHGPIAALVRGVLLRAAASSPAALAEALRRYRGLLLHARDARQAGRVLSRAELREFAGEVDDQLVLWQLVGEGSGDVELELDDLAVVDAVLAHAAEAAAGGDPKLERLRAVLADRRPTVIFTTRRETVRHLRDQLAPPPVAWCTGERAGLGILPAPRASVLAWFRDDRPGRPTDPTRPPCLVVTDVAAEGLDLRRAERVVHYDLPWTPMRLEQREGRAVRLGSSRKVVEVVRFMPPAALDAALGLARHLRGKAALPALAGLGRDGLLLWRWRSALADRLGEGPAAPGTAVVAGEGEEGALAGFELLAVRSGARAPLGAVVGWLGADGSWREDEAIVAPRLLLAGAGARRTPADPTRVRQALDGLAGVVRTRLALAAGRRWEAAEPDPAARRLAQRLGELVQTAARRRDAYALARLERALARVAGGHTAGEAMLVRRLAETDAPAMVAGLDQIPAPTPRWDAIEVRLIGLILFGGL